MDSPAFQRRALAVTLALPLLLGACSKKQEANLAAPVAETVEAKVVSQKPGLMDSARVANVTSQSPPPPPPAEAGMPAPAVTGASTTQQMGSSSTTYTDNERKFIRTAQARFQVKDVYVAALGIEDTVASHGGFVVKNNITTNKQSAVSQPAGDNKLIELAEYVVQGQLIVRVPSAKTQEFLRAIVGHIVFLDQRNFDARDAQFDLLRQQLEMMRNNDTQKELGQAIGDGGRLGSKAEAIATRNEVKAARDAALVARKEFEDQVAFSTIELTLHQPAKVVQSEHVDVHGMFRQFRPGFFPRLGESLRDGWAGFLDLLVGLAAIWPLLLLLAAAVAVVMRLRGRRRHGLHKPAFVPGDM